MYVHFEEGDPLKLIVLKKRLQFAATHKLGVLLGVDSVKVRGGERGGECSLQVCVCMSIRVIVRT